MSEAELREALGGEPTELVRKKIADRLNPLTRQFVERSPFVVVATGRPEGGLDVSPRGDPAGFVRILNERTLLLPDRPGNKLADTLTNLLEDDRIALLFLIPGVNDTFRVNGRARIADDPELLAASEVEGKVPRLGSRRRTRSARRRFCGPTSGTPSGTSTARSCRARARSCARWQTRSSTSRSTRRHAPSGTGAARGSTEPFRLLVELRRCGAARVRRIDVKLRARPYDRLAFDDLPGVVTQVARTASRHWRAVRPPALGEVDARGWLHRPAGSDVRLADPLIPPG